MRRALMVGLLTSVTGCPPPTTPSAPGASEPTISARAAAQRQSLRSVWYRGNPLPPRPSPEERATTRRRLAGAATHERALLEKLYPGDDELWVYATRDTDGDGINDYRISDYLGKFLENDRDLDGDGIDNYADSAPFEPSSAERAYLLEALDWSRDASKSRELAEIQRHVFGRHNVLLVERDADFSLSLARAVRDALPLLLSSQYPDGAPTLSTIATERSSLLDPEHPEGTGDFAQAFAASESLTVYQLGIEAEPVIQLGLLVHEIAHSLQAAMDYRPTALARGRYGPPRQLQALMARFGWTFDRPPRSAETYALLRPHYSGGIEYSASWQGRSHEEWLAELDDMSLRSDEARQLRIIGTYALSDPSEWYADHVISYVYITLIDSVRAACQPSEWKELATWLDDVVTDSWPEYSYANARGSPFQDELARRFPIDANTRQRLATRYLERRRFCKTL